MQYTDLAEWDAETPVRAPSPGGRPAKDLRGRQRKLACGSCGFIAYASAGALERSGYPERAPACACGERLALANFRDRVALEPLEVWAGELASASADGKRAMRAELRRLGYADPTAPIKRDAGGASQKRCEWDGGYCVRFATGRYCNEHDPHKHASRERAQVRKFA